MDHSFETFDPDRLVEIVTEHASLEGPLLPILHALVRRLAEAASAGANDKLADAAWLLLDQARLVEGEAPADPLAFAKRLAAVMERAI